MNDLRRRVLVEPAELATRLAEDPHSLVLADVRWNLNGPPGRAEFEAGHLPGATWVDLEAELSGPAGPGGRHPLPAPDTFAAAVARLGVDADSDVVVYDAATSLAAARLWWLLTDAGHVRVRVLDGGYAGWVAAGHPTATGPGARRRPGTFEPQPGQRRRADTAEILATPGRTLVDVRAEERFRGTSEPIDPVAGHIPGARNRPSMANLDAQHRFAPPAQIAAAYAGLVEPVLYCGSGITAAHALLALESAGRWDACIYPGSWSEWIVDPRRPVATGAE